MHLRRYEKYDWSGANGFFFNKNSSIQICHNDLKDWLKQTFM